PDQRALIPSPAQSVSALCLCSYRPTSTSSGLSRPHPARLSIFWRALRHAFSRSCRHAEPGRLSQQRLRRKERTTTPHRPKSRKARVIEFVEYRPFQFTNFKDSTNRGSRTGKSDVFPTIRK